MSDNSNTKKMYILLSATPYKTGKAIRFITGTKYNHASFALDPSLSELYAFSRYYENTTFFAGFTEESFMRYQVKKNDSQIAVAELPLTDAQYGKLLEKLERIKASREEYVYNYFSLAAAPFGKSVRIDSSYTCIEFVVSILSYLGIYRSKDLSPTFDSFYKMLQKYIIFEGLSRDYNICETWGKDRFYEQKSRSFYVLGMSKNMKKLVKKYKARPKNEKSEA